ncbi:unnamed protein product [Allacma fusca]|uniref:Uncharacterized protein n=1 Tax=Allacma fusca TaxID=39272 RepID=A0A8J2LSB0_9HEXA|nr:unnamed protein product [Allacma fusca]
MCRLNIRNQYIIRNCTYLLNQFYTVYIILSSITSPDKVLSVLLFIHTGSIKRDLYQKFEHYSKNGFDVLFLPKRFPVEVRIVLSHFMVSYSITVMS